MKTKRATGLALLAALLYAINAPFSKLLLTKVSPTVMAALLYLGAGLGMLVPVRIRRRRRNRREEPLTCKDLPYTLLMVVLDVAAPILLMLGLRHSTAASVSLLNNFEIVATALIALFIFRERVSGRLWGAIGLVTLACLLLSLEDGEALTFSVGSLFVLLACLCWGFENNCTRRLSAKDPLQIVVVKGIGSGLTSLFLALAIGERLPENRWILPTLVLGFVAYGMSIGCYIYAQRELGAAKTSTYYAVAPFVGAALSLLVFSQAPSPSFLVAFGIMMLGTYFAATDAP